MRDEETGSWWQQITGEAIQGKLKSQQLIPVASDEISFGIWKRENPNGRVLRPDEKIAAQGKYEPWEESVAKMPVNIVTKLDETLPPRELIVGIALGGKAKAYPFSAIEKQNPIIDTVDETDIVILLGADGKSVRAFERKIDGKRLELYARPDSRQLIDAETGSIWDFSGRAVSGTLAGRQLKQVTILKDYWFDWKTYNPETQLYSLGSR